MADVLFQPLSFRNLTVKNRVFRSNISGRFDNYDGSGNQARINWEVKFAKGGVGAIISSFVPVHLNGRSVKSCSVLAVQADGGEVTTIEGVARDGNLHPVQEAFADTGAVQCGFCTPGMVMSCAALLERKSNPSLADVKHAVSGNLCRCGTYPKVFAATLDVARHGKRGADLAALNPAEEA